MVTLDYAGPNLVPVATATELNQYHLHYFLDVDPTPYIGTTTPIPTGNPHIIHTAETYAMFDSVVPGRHRLAVVLMGSNHISVNPPITNPTRTGGGIRRVGIHAARPRSDLTGAKVNFGDHGLLTLSRYEERLRRLGQHVP
jgi:hypothetical protein